MPKEYTRAELRRALRLYAVTDRAWLGGRTLQDCVSDAIAGGVTFVQLREKDTPRFEALPLARDLQAICAQAGVPFVVNDDLELALEAGADGVHLGQDDMDCAEARAILGPERIIGVSVQTEEQALRAADAGADYLGVGALMPTPTKPDAVDVTKAELAAICAAADLPIVGIGGLNAQTIGDFAGLGLDGVAVVSALFAADDCKAAAWELRRAIEEVRL